MEEFRFRFQEALDRSGYRAIDVAEHCKIPRSTVSYYLSGRIKPKSKRLHDIALMLDVQETWLMGYDVEMDRDAAERERILKNEIERMFYELSSDQQDTVFTLMQTMIEQNRRKKDA